MPIHILKTHAFHADEREARIIFKRKKKGVSNVQHFRLPVLRCEGLFICGILFLLIIALESQSVTPSLRLSQVFQTISPKRSTPGWLTSELKRVEKSVCLSVFFNHPFTPHMFKPMYSGRSSSIGTS